MKGEGSIECITPMRMETHSSDPGTKTVELLGLARTEPTARRRDAFLSFNSLVCCASLRSSGDVNELNQAFNSEGSTYTVR